MALKFLNKKGWHTGSLRNIENVWKAEQKHNAEEKKLDELRKQIQEERERSEFRLLQEQAGLVLRQERLDFLYESGLAVGKSSEGFKELAVTPAAPAAAPTEASSSKNEKDRSVFMGEKRKAKPDQHPWQRRRKEEPQCHYDGLPVDILHEILIWFSLKTLSQFRCICKQWYRLISDPCFQQDHYRRHSQQDPILFVTRCEFNNNETNTLHLSTYTKGGTLVNNFSKENLEQCNYVPIQSCLGLVCIGAMFTRTPILLCNPATGEIITLPPTQGKHRAIGFGYAASTKEFKVVRLFCHDPDDTKFFCEIFVLGTNKWREVVAPPPQYSFTMGAAPFLNGAIHLMSSCAGMHGNKIDPCIDVFDIETEKYTKIPLPRYYHIIGNYRSRRIYLRLLGGSLCLIFDLGRSLEIWSLKDYQQREWVKEYDIDHSSFVPHPRAEPLAIMGDGSMLLSMSRNWGRNPSLYWYDFRNKSFLEDGKENCWGVSYVESLLFVRNRP